MILFVDSSALAKRYVDEPGSAAMIGIPNSAVVLVSPLTWAEVDAALVRRFRDGNFDLLAYRYACDAFHSDWQSFSLIIPGPHVLNSIQRITFTYGLRGADALQCASAKAVSSRPRVRFVCSDQRLLAAASAEGLDVWDPVQGDT